MKAKMISSSKDHMWEEKDIESISSSSYDIEIMVDDYQQTILGFGGAITHSSIENYKQMDVDLQKQFNELLYGKNGLSFNSARISIGTCDFCPRDFDYALLKDLSDFSIYPYEQEIIDYIHYLQKNYTLSYIKAAVWSPLAFYKDSHSKLDGKLLYDFYPKHAQYVALFVEQYKEENIDINFLSINNEPEAIVPWEHCLYTVKEEANLAKYYKKYLEKYGIFDTKLCIFDHNYDHLYTWVSTSFELLKTRDLFDGIAYHWYGDEDFENIAKIYERYSDKTLILSETCIEAYKKEIGGNFDGALRYFRNYLFNMLYGTMLFIDWNILLNEEGGINHVGNNCESPVMFDRVNKSLIVNPSYYGIKHFSHFIHHNAKSLKVKNCHSLVKACSALNDNGSMVVNLYNGSAETIQNLRLKIGDQVFEIDLAPLSIHTVYLKEKI